MLIKRNRYLKNSSKIHQSEGASKEPLEVIRNGWCLQVERSNLIWRQITEKGLPTFFCFNQWKKVREENNSTNFFRLPLPIFTFVPLSVFSIYLCPSVFQIRSFLLINCLNLTYAPLLILFLSVYVSCVFWSFFSFFLLSFFSVFGLCHRH